MNNFLEFIEKDIEAKKILISTLPTKTKANKKKFNENIDSILKKYIEYKKCLKNYLLAKSRSLTIKEKEEDLEKLNDNISKLEHARFVLNPTNTYFEKMGFDNLIYRISNYYNFNFNCLNDIINDFIDKFELASIELTKEDFDYTYYVYEYMTVFLETRNSKSETYNKVSEKFEQIYWLNPEIIEHIELNFRKLIRKYQKKFEIYINKLQKEIMIENKIKNYDDCLDKLKNAYIELNFSSRETVTDILNAAKKGEFDISQYLPNSKVREVAFSSLAGESIDLSNKNQMIKFCDSLEKFKMNIEEYANYLEFTELFNNFKEEYGSILDNNNSKKNRESKELLNKIIKSEQELAKISSPLMKKKSLFNNISEKKTAELKLLSAQKAKEIHKMYEEYDIVYFKDVVLGILNKNISVADVLNIYYSFDYFKKIAIQKAYQLNDYDEIIKYSESFDIFSMDPTNAIVRGTFLFEEDNIANNMANKYRLNGIRLTDSDLDEDNLKILLNKILLILRVNKIENSNTSVEKLWFIVQVEKILEKEASKKLAIEK